MTKQLLNVGSSANDGTGDTLRDAGIKINDNFGELYDSIGTINTSGVSTFSGLVSGITSITELRLSSTSDKTTIFNGNDITLSYNSGGGNIAICLNPTGPIKLNVVDIPTDSSFNNRILSFSVIVNQGTTAYACTSVTLNGVAFGANAAVGVQTHIAYLFGVVSTGNTSGYDFFNFTAINTVGSAATTSNYKILSNVSGGYQRY